jgi:hypothetical protein
MELKLTTDWARLPKELYPPILMCSVLVLVEAPTNLTQVHRDLPQSLEENIRIVPRLRHGLFFPDLSNLFNSPPVSVDST